MSKFIPAIIIAITFLMLSTNSNAYTLRLVFQDKEEALNWMEWYLDHGENYSSFYARDWSDRSMVLLFDDNYWNENKELSCTQLNNKAPKWD